MKNSEKIGSKKDCFAYNAGNLKSNCVALKELYCQKEHCKFYKPKVAKTKKRVL